MKLNANALILSMLIAGSSSTDPNNTVDYNTVSPAAFCAALGGFKAQHNEVEFDRLQGIAKARIEANTFSISAVQCQDMAIKGMIVTGLNEELSRANCAEVS